MIAASRALEPSRRVIAFLLLCAIGIAAFRSAWAILPTRGDNLYVLAWVDQAPLSALLPLDQANYPEWRPLAYLTVWLGHHLVAGQAAAIHLGVNLLLWVLCAWLVLMLVHGITSSTWSAAAAAVLLLIDERAINTLTWIVERQMSLACALGLTATLLLVRTTTASAQRQALVAVLLLGSGLAKEYGLAFALALVGHGLLWRRRDYARPAAVALAAYCAVRLWFTGGAGAVYCEDMGLGFTTELRCVNPLDPSTWPQMAYNGAATLVSSLLPGFFTGEGALQVGPSRVLLGAPLLLLAAIGAAARPRLGSLLLWQTVATAILSVFLFRHRNQLVVACAMAIAAGCGLAHVSALLSQFRSARLVHGLVAVVIAIPALMQVITSRARIEAEVEAAILADPCDASIRERAFGSAYVASLKAQYGLPNGECAPRRTP